MRNNPLIYLIPITFILITLSSILVLFKQYALSMTILFLIILTYMFYFTGSEKGRPKYTIVLPNH